jgi:Flp pilus assembly protein TadD
MRPHAWIAAALVFGVVAVFAPVRQHAFVDYDDPVWVSQLAPGFTRAGFRNACCDEIVANWIPTTALWMLAERALHGGSAPGYLVGNVALHALSTVLLYAVLVSATGAMAPSAFVAAVFGWHPLHVESVAWVSQRKDVLCGLFWVIALALHARAVRRPSLGRRAATLAAVALALTAKPMAVTLPFTLVLFEWWPLRSLPVSPRTGLPTAAGLARALRAQLPALALAAAISAVAYRVQSASGAVAARDALPFSLRVDNAIHAVVAYLADAVWPHALAAFYPHPTEIVSASATVAAAAALLAFSAALVFAARRAPAALVGWLWFLGTLVPVLGLVQVGLQARADRYTYVPLIGLAWAVAFPVAALVSARPLARRALGVAALAAVVALGVAARAQVETWRNSLSLYARAVAVTPPNAFATLGYGRALRRAGHAEEAIAALREASRLDPSSATPHLELAEMYAERGDLELAVVRQRAAAERDPEDPRYQLRLGQLLLQAGRAGEARAPLARAGTLLVEGAPSSAALRRLHAQASARAALADGDVADALRHTEALLAQDPRSIAALSLLAQIALRNGQPAAALAPLQEWAARTPEAGEPHAWLGIALLRQGRVDEARAALLRARAQGFDSAAVREALAEVKRAESAASNLE